MPLIMISGYPSSGKSQRATQIADYFNARISSAGPGERESRLRVHVVSPDSLGLSRECYREARAEKEARATEYSAVKRLLGKDGVVIADGLNYIKGYRYQLYCEAKAAMTPSCVVHVAAPSSDCKTWNASREDSHRYADDVLENLIFRYEEPNGMARWDSQLFVVPYIDAEPDLAGIWEAMVGRGVVVKPNQATVVQPPAESEYLYELERTTQDVVSLILEHQRAGGGGGGTLPVPDSSVALELPPQELTLPQLQRVRRQYVALSRKHSAVGKRRIRELFVEHLNGTFR